MPERIIRRQEGERHIEAIFLDGTSHHVLPRVLDVLLENNSITRFKRTDGWVTVGVDPVRAKRRNDLCPLYYGPERRVAVRWAV